MQFYYGGGLQGADAFAEQNEVRVRGHPGKCERPGVRPGRLGDVMPAVPGLAFCDAQLSTAEPAVAERGAVGPKMSHMAREPADVDQMLGILARKKARARGVTAQSRTSEPVITVIMGSSSALIRLRCREG